MRKEYKAKRRQTTDTASDNLLSALIGQDTSKVLELEEYDFTKPPSQNSRAARNNMLIDLIQKRLSDPETLKRRVTPGGFEQSSAAARMLRELLYGNTEDFKQFSRGKSYNSSFDSQFSFSSIMDYITAKVESEDFEDPEPNYDPSDPLTIVRFNQQNQVAGKLIGIFANHNTNHAFASIMRTFELRNAVAFAGHSYSDLLHNPRVNTDINMAEFLAAAVDAVKDPVLNYLNYNTITADSAALLARLGYTPKEIGLLLNQPIIKEVCDYCLNNECSLEIGMRNVRAQYLKNPEVADFKNMTSPNDFTVDKLIDNILGDRTNRENNREMSVALMNEQMKVLELFNSISTAASEVSQFVTSTKFTASNAVGSTFGDLYAQQMRVNKYLNDVCGKNIQIAVTDRITLPINNDAELLQLNDEEYYESLLDNPFAYEQAMYDMNRRALRELSRYFPYNKECYSAARSTLAGFTKMGTLDAETINSIHSDLMVYMLSQEEHSDFNGELPKFGTGHDNADGTVPTVREYYTQYFAKDLYNELKSNPALKNLAIFRYLTHEADSEGNVTANVQGVGGLAPHQKDEIRESWADLAKVNPLIARDLFLYNFYRQGFQFGPNSFMNLAPTEVKLAIQVPRQDGSARSYVEFLREVAAGDININAEDFAIQYALNHSDNNQLVFNADRSRTASNMLRGKVFDSMRNMVSSFTIDLSKEGEDAEQFLLKKATKSDPVYKFVPVISYKGALYVATNTDGSTASFNATTGTSMTYVRMNQQGRNGISMSYYGRNTATVKPAKGQNNEGPVGNSSQEAGSPGVTFDRESSIAEISKEIAAGMMESDGLTGDAVQDALTQAVANSLQSASDTQLQTKIEDIRKACRKDGILLLNDKGELLTGC